MGYGAEKSCFVLSSLHFMLTPAALDYEEEQILKLFITGALTPDVYVKERI